MIPEFPAISTPMTPVQPDALLFVVDDEVLLAAVQQGLDRARRHGRNNAGQARAALY